jgi:hypothetical protein
MVNIFKRLGRSLGSGVRWIGRQVKHAGQLQTGFLNKVNDGAKFLGRQVSKLPGGQAIVSGVKSVINDAKIPIINKSLGDLYQAGKSVAGNVTNLGRSVSNVGEAVQQTDRMKMLKAMKEANQRFKETKSSVNRVL